MLDAFSYDVGIDLPGDLDDVGQDRQITFLRIVDKTLIDLNSVEIDLTEQGEGGAGASEVVDGNLVAQSVKFVYKGSQCIYRKLVRSLSNFYFNKFLRNT